MSLTRRPPREVDLALERAGCRGPGVVRMAVERWRPAPVAAVSGKTEVEEGGAAKNTG